MHAVAQGKIERFGRAKVVQPLDPGKVSAIHVAAGDHVTAGQIIFELDPAETLADAGAQSDAQYAGWPKSTGAARPAKRRARCKRR